MHNKTILSNLILVLQLDVKAEDYAFTSFTQRYKEVLMKFLQEWAMAQVKSTLVAIRI